MSRPNSARHCRALVPDDLLKLGELIRHLLMRAAALRQRILGRERDRCVVSGVAPELAARREKGLRAISNSSYVRQRTDVTE